MDKFARLSCFRGHNYNVLSYYLTPKRMYSSMHAEFKQQRIARAVDRALLYAAVVLVTVSVSYMAGHVVAFAFRNICGL